MFFLKRRYARVRLCSIRLKKVVSTSKPLDRLGALHTSYPVWTERKRRKKRVGSERVVYTHLTLSLTSHRHSVETWYWFNLYGRCVFIIFRRFGWQRIVIFHRSFSHLRHAGCWSGGIHIFVFGPAWIGICHVHSHANVCPSLTHVQTPDSKV